jgi:hypothetical protein
MKNNIVLLLLSLACASLTSSCSSVYYDTMEKFGVHKRDILVDDVKDARSSQAAAKEQFKDALEQFSSVVNFKGGDLEAKYNKLNKEFQKSEAAATAVNDRIAAIESVSSALFKEWKQELKQYSNDKLRAQSQKELAQTQQQYNQMIQVMKKSAASMTPVLNAFRDQVLFLKHNLNARAIAGIKDEASKIEADVSRLIKEMESSIAEADSFIQSMGVE